MVNHFILQGRFVADPELKSNTNGKDYTSFTVAWSEKRGEYERRLYLRCIAWAGTARLICSHFAKGQQIIVSGKLVANEWEDDQGNKRREMQLQVERVDFAGSKPEGEGARPMPGSSGASGYAPAGLMDIDIGDGELPF